MKNRTIANIEDLKYSELSSTATLPDDEGVYKTVTWKDANNDIYAVSTLLGTSPYSQVKIEYYIGGGVVKTIIWDLTYDDNGFPYKREVN